MNAFRSPRILLFDYTHRHSIRLAHLSGFLVVPNAVGLAFYPQVRQDWSVISLFIFGMPLPKWSTMTDESQAMVKKTGVGFGVGILVVWIALGFVKAVLPLVLLSGAGYVAWKVLKKQ